MSQLNIDTYTTDDVVSVSQPFSNGRTRDGTNSNDSQGSSLNSMVDGVSLASPTRPERRKTAPGTTTLFSPTKPRRFTDEGRETGSDSEMEPTSTMTRERHDYIIKLFTTNASKLIKQRRAEIDKNGAFAALCVRDAFEGRLGNGLATNSTKSAFIFGIYSLQTNEHWMNLVILSSAFHSILTFMEPGYGVDTCSDADWNDQSYWDIIGPFLVYLHYLIWFIHALDAGMKVFYQGVREYFNHDWQQLYITAIFLHFVDLCIFKQTYMTNPLRPVVGLLRDRRGRRFFSVVKLILYQMQEFLMPLFAFVFMIAVGCVLKEAKADSSHTLVYYGYNWLCLILTNDTFSRLFPDIDASSDIMSALAIFLLMYFGQGFIVNVLLGATLETFRAVSTKQIKKENLKRNQGLVKAFAVLDTHKSGRIQLAQFTTFLQHWKPELNTVQQKLYYELICAGDQEGVTVFQFMKLPDFICYYFEKETIVTKQIDASQEFIQNICTRLRQYCYIPSLRPHLMTIRNLLQNVKLFYYLNYLDIFLFFIQVQEQPLISSSSWVHVSPTICNFINTLYVLELILELSHREGDLYSLLTELDTFLGFFTMGIMGIGFLDILKLIGMYPQRGDLVKILLQSFRCCRILITNADLSAFLSSVVSVGPLFFENMVFGLVILYMHGMAGYLLFGSTLDMWATPINATVTVQKLFLPFDLLDIMELTMEKVHKLSILFFFLYFLMSIIVSNLSLSIILEWHAQMFEELSKPANVAEKKKVSHEILFKTIKDRVISKSAYKKNPSFADIAKANELATTIAKYRMYFRGKKADYRMKFVDDIEHLSAKDLKACQKYSTIDLAAFSKLINRQQKDLTWETDFVEHARKDHSVHAIKAGNTFIVQGEAALKCFLISSGTVIVEVTVTKNKGNTSSKRVEKVEIGSINLVGSACLTPDSRYHYSCTAVQDVECLIFTQETILQELDSDHAGQLLRMAHKTSAVLKDLVSRKKQAKEAKKNIQRRRRSTSAAKVGTNQFY
mmetsp:Transcript_6435/g.12358  ORF Transcript_6435/g.12358 Transcript_6435/m.12358 type:complete len:1014 (-) Transcript_6435:1303-4344(-)